MRPWLAFLLVGNTLSAAQTDLGGANVLFPLLQDPAGARSLSMGGAFEAMGEGAESALYNPAAPAFAEGLDLGLHHDVWLANTSRESLQLSTPAGRRGGLSGFGTYVAYPSLELRDSQGRLQGGAQPNDWGVGLAGGLRVWDRVGLGFGVQALRQDLPGLSLRGFQAQAGLLAKPLQNLNVALVLRNRPLRDADAEKRGFVSSVGAALRLGEAYPFTGALSVNLDPEAPAQLHIGVEQGMGPASSRLALRGGYTAYFPSYSLGAGHGLVLGLGMSMGRFGVDYASQFFGAFGITHQVSLTWTQPRPLVAQAAVQPAQQTVAEAVPGPTPEPTPPPAQVPALEPLQAAPPSTTLLVLSPKYVEGQAFEHQGRWLEALQAYQEAVAADEKDVAAWLGQSRAYRALGRIEEAGKAVEKAAALQSGP